MVSDENDLLLSQGLDVEKQKEGTKQSLWNDADYRQKVLLLYVTTTNFLAMFCNSVSSPFLARVILHKHGSLLYSAIILQSTMLTMALSSIAFGKHQAVVGCRRLFIGGLGLFSLCQIALGVSATISNTDYFVAAGTVLNGLQGIGQGAFSVSSLTLLCRQYPRNIRKVFGFTEAAFGAGYLMGPLFGGALYDFGGMLLPMMISGTVTLVTVPVGIFLLRSYTFNDSAQKEISVNKLFGIPNALFLLLATGSVFGGLGLCNSILTSYAESRSFSVTGAGTVLFAMGISHFLGATTCGYLVNQNDWIGKLMMVVGYAGSSLIGLIYTNDQTEAWIYVGSVLLGLFSALSFVSSFDRLLRIYSEGAVDEDASFAVHSTVSGAWYFVLGVTTFVLSLVGSALNIGLGSFSLALVITICIGYAFSLLFGGTVYAMKMFRK